MHTLNGKIPYEALYGRPPNLSALRTWGIPVLVHSTDQSELHPHMHEAQWLDFDTNMRAHQVYWPGPGNVTVEWNVYFGMTALLKGEDEEAPAANSKQTVAPGTPTSPPVTDLSNLFKMPAKTPADDDNDVNDGNGKLEPKPEPKKKQVQPEPQPTQLCRSMRNRRPSCQIRDLQSGEGVTLARKGSPRVTIGLHVKSAAGLKVQCGRGC